MALIETCSPADATGDVRQMYARQQAAYGYVPNYAKAFSHRPELMKLWADLLKGIRRHLEPRRFELATFAAAHALRHSYCALAHGQALTKLLTAEAVLALAQYPDQPQRAGLTPADAALFAFARKAALDASTISRDDVDALKTHGFTDAEVFDIAAAAAARAFFTKLLDAVGAEPDSVFLDLDGELRNALAVGRDIAHAAPERLIDAERPGAAVESASAR